MAAKVIGVIVVLVIGNVERFVPEQTKAGPTLTITAEAGVPVNVPVAPVKTFL
jgi:hypothetical protein